MVASTASPGVIGSRTTRTSSRVDRNGHGFVLLGDDDLPEPRAAGLDPLGTDVQLLLRPSEVLPVDRSGCLGGDLGIGSGGAGGVQAGACLDR